jgi:hypothetical protein
VNLLMIRVKLAAWRKSIAQWKTDLNVIREKFISGIVDAASAVKRVFSQIQVKIRSMKSDIKSFNKTLKEEGYIASATETEQVLDDVTELDAECETFKTNATAWEEAHGKKVTVESAIRDARDVAANPLVSGDIFNNAAIELALKIMTSKKEAELADLKETVDRAGGFYSIESRKQNESRKGE